MKLPFLKRIAHLQAPLALFPFDVNELYSLYALFPNKKENIIASGGAVRKNEILKKLICDIFGTNLRVSDLSEEAALGAAIFSLISTGKIKYE